MNDRELLEMAAKAAGSGHIDLSVMPPAPAVAAPAVAAPAVPEEWIERWYGSGEAKDIGIELCRGSHIYTKNSREHIAFLGDTDAAHDLCTEIVFQHNRAMLQSTSAPTLNANAVAVPDGWLKCWLIERPASSEWPAIWLTITTDGRRWVSDGGTMYATGGDWYFTSAASEALKFADKESADEYVRHNKIKDVVVTEHIFDNRALLQSDMTDHTDCINLTPDVPAPEFRTSTKNSGADI